MYNPWSNLTPHFGQLNAYGQVIPQTIVPCPPNTIYRIPMPYPQSVDYFTYLNPLNPSIPSLVPTAPQKPPTTISNGSSLQSSTPLPSPINSMPNIKPVPDKISNKKTNGVYKCQKCERIYLSYPALYTHNKLKHADYQVNTTRTSNRGRPKKNVS